MGKQLLKNGKPVEKQNVRDTSIQNYHQEESRGKNELRRQQILDVMKGEGWLTGREVWKKLIDADYAEPPKHVYSSYRPRMTEMVDTGQLEESDNKKECSVTGKKVYQYRRQD